jgi:hypothetical protein
MFRSSGAVATVLGFAVCTACTDRLTAPEAVELVTSIEKSFAENSGPQRWLADVWKGDVRLGALTRTDLRRDDEMRPYQSIVFERIVLASPRPGRLLCAGTRHAAYFRRADNDGAVFFPGGWFDQRLVGCSHESAQEPALHVITPDQSSWLAESVQGEISPGVVTGRCSFLEPESERVLREEHGITCAVTRHRVHFAARLEGFAVGGPDKMRLELDTTEIVGVRYTIDCPALESTVRPCARDSDAP